MKNKTSITTRFRNAFTPALLGAASLLFAATSASGQNLISWYTLNGNGIDQGSIGADGTLNGSAEFVADGPGAYNQSLGLNGSLGYVSAATGDSFTGLEQITITLWVNVQGALGDKGDRLVSNLNGNGGFDVRFAPHSGSGVQESYRVMFGVNTSSGGATSSSISSNGEWAFVAITYNQALPSRQVEFYFGDETNAVQSWGSGSSSTPQAIKTGGELRIGELPLSTTGDRTPPAYISDVRIYDAALSLEQLEDIRASVAVIPEPAHFAAIFGGVILAMLYLRRRKS